MAFEEDFKKNFPSLEGKEHYAHNHQITPNSMTEKEGDFKIGWGKKLYGYVILVANVHRDEKKFDSDYYKKEDIQENCLDKQKKHCLTSDEVTELMAKGEVITVDGLKLSALSKPTSPTMQRFKEEHILLYDYKQKVKDTLNELRRRVEKKQSEAEWTAFDDAEKELGLE